MKKVIKEINIPICEKNILPDIFIYLHINVYISINDSSYNTDNNRSHS